jgi:RecB family exonuclease
MYEEYREQTAEMTERLFRLDLVEVHPPPEPLRSVSVTGLVTYAQCPKRFYWSDIDPLPRRRNPAAVRGSEIHRRIELHQRGQVPFEEMSQELYDAVEGPYGPGGGYRAYEQSRFASVDATLIEVPFTVRLANDYQVRGRIDAIYVSEGRWEIVDFKSGAPNADESRIVQLQAYAVAARSVDFGIAAPSQIDVTFAYLGGGLEETTVAAGAVWVKSAEKRLLEITDAIDAASYEPTPGEWCRHCDFLHVCEAGQGMVDGRAMG